MTAADRRASAERKATAKAAESAAWEQLDRAMLNLAANGRQTPCSGRFAEFTSDSPQTLREAATACHTCPVRDACAGIVPFVSHGVWGGQVLVQTTQQKRPRKAS